MKSKMYEQTERELEATQQQLVHQIKSAQELYGRDASELRTSRAALKAINKNLNSIRRRKSAH